MTDTAKELRLKALQEEQVVLVRSGNVAKAMELRAEVARLTEECLGEAIDRSVEDEDGSPATPTD